MLKLNIQLFAHHKGQGSTSNGRDSAGRRLGAKAADGEFVTAGSILYRQRGTKIYPGTNVDKGSDDTLFAFHWVNTYLFFVSTFSFKFNCSIY